MSKYSSIPIHLIKFWYLESIDLFVKTWRNLILFLEEDLAVGLMWRLLFAPLFHDATVVGRILSFLFRISRILVGLFAFALATSLVFALGVYWLLLPLFVVLGIFGILDQIALFLGFVIFIIHIFSNPEKKTWQIKDGNFWSSSKVDKKDVDFKKLLASLQVAEFLSYLEIRVSHLPNFEMQDPKLIDKEAFDLAKRSQSPYIEPIHFFVSFVKHVPNIEQFLLKLDLKLDDFEQTLLYLDKKRNSSRKIYIWDDDFIIHHLKGVNRGWLGVPTPNLDLVSQDLTKVAATMGFADLIREGSIITEISNTLSQVTGRNVIVVGPPGSGKTALIKYLAKQIVAGDAPSSLATKRIVLLDLTKLLSGIKTQGELADRIKNIFEELEFAQNVIIVIEEIHELGMGEVGSSLNLYSLMQPYLESDTFQFIATTEVENYSRVVEKNGSFARIFRKIEITPATPQETLKVLQDRSIESERKTKVKTTYIAIKTAVELASKLIQDRVLPDSAIAVLKEAQAQAVAGWVTKEIIQQVVSKRVKVPVLETGNLDNGKLLNLEDEIHRNLIDQEQAVKVISDSLRRQATGLREEKRPIGSFLFVGPTGVGKTELAKTLAKVYFQTDGAFIRFDMSEYQNSESVSRLIGGSGEGGLLTEAIRNRPYSILLLDEFEKAEPKILTLFLQVLDDGRLTDGAGRTVSFQNTIIIATSNAGSLLIASGLKQGKDLLSIDKEVNSELLRIFKPELVNRFDDVVIFKPLSEENLQKIVRLKLKSLKDQLWDKGYMVEFDDNLTEQLGKLGFDPVLGARPLRRLIQDTLEAKLSKLILENKLTKGQPFTAGIDLLRD